MRPRAVFGGLCYAWAIMDTAFRTEEGGGAMIKAYVLRDRRLVRLHQEEGEQGGEEHGQGGGLHDAVWIDLVDPTDEEVHATEAVLGVEVPSREAMEEIEPSSRLYRDGDVSYMTATVLADAETDHPTASAISFVLADGRLVTLRHTDPTPFRAFQKHVERHPRSHSGADAVLVGLIEAIIDRAADILEMIGGTLDGLSESIFRRKGGDRLGSDELRDLMRQIGHNGDLLSKSRMSLVSINRLLTFLIQTAEEQGAGHEIPRLLRTQGHDVASLSDHASFLANKVNFMLDATLGMISVEQNAIIKVVSLAAAVFLPPTLIASVYGMNFDLMPELDWPFGYPIALLLMVLSAVLPYWWFKHRGWL